MLSVANLHPLLHVCEEAADARAARELYPWERPEVVVLDIVLPHGDGIELLREFARYETKCWYVVVSELCDAGMVQRAFDAGAQAYVSKRDEAAELLCALEAVITDGTYVSKIVSQNLRSDVSRRRLEPALKLLGNLSDREMHIFCRIGQEQGTTAIAQALGLSVKTVETHQARIKEKLHLSGSAQLHRVAENWMAAHLGG